MLLALSLGITVSAYASTPYDDVPLDHWAYDAIETLTVHGVIDGYPDGTFRGNQPITRFEMAKMIRNAVLSQDEIHDKDRKLLDKLANEYKEELKGFNVRIVELERRVGNIQWKGNIRYRYINDHISSGGGMMALFGGGGSSRSRSMLQYMTATLEPDIKIAKNWTGHLRMNYNLDLRSGGNSTNDSFGGGGGNDIMSMFLGGGGGTSQKTNYLGMEVFAAPGKASVGFGYHRFGNRNFDDDGGIFSLFGGDSEKMAADIFAVGGSYQFDKIFGLNVAAAWNTKKDMGYNGSKRSWQVEATFGKEDQKKAGNVTGYIAYRHLGNSVSWRPDYEVMDSGQKGWDFGVKYVIYKDIVASLRYFNGKAIKDGTNENTLFGEVYCYF